MLFNSFHYIGFLALVLLLAGLLRRWPGAERWFLVAASAWFYGQWNWHYLLLIYITISVDYVLGQRIYRHLQPKRAMALSLLVNLGILAFFKYANFLIFSFNGAVVATGLSMQLSPLELLLPVGISFYTFQSLSYTIDLYRGQLQPRRNFRDYALFVSFFPQLVAGPIVRASEFFEQLDGRRLLDFRAAQVGVFLVTLGLVKKVVFADNLALVVDPVFDDPASATSLETLLAIYAFAFQIYFDFSGYTDIAIGSARLLGFSFPTNFNYPYLALSIRDFWQRWHMTLSRWLRDYLYISLGGNRCSRLLSMRNLMLTMLLGGLWHGAYWQFVAWGALHGAYLIIERYWPANWRLLPGTEHRGGRLLRRLWIFHWVCFAWIFFRADSFADAGLILQQLAGITDSVDLGRIAGPQLLLILLLPGLHYLAHRFGLIRRAGETGTLEYVSLQTVLLLSLLIFVPASSAPFIYFQF